MRDRQLIDFIEGRRGRPFSWGDNDCAMFAADWVLKQTGIDPLAPFRGRYSTAAGSVRALRRYGTGELISTWMSSVGAPLASVRLAMRGDVVAKAMPDGDALGIVVDHRAAFVAPAGLRFEPVESCRLAWRV